MPGRISQEEPFAGPQMCVSQSYQPKAEEPSPPSPGAQLKALADSLPPGRVTLATIRDYVGRDGLLILTLFLTLIFIVPVSIPGISTVFGGAILLIGFSRLFRRSLWLPKQITEHRLPADKLRTALHQGAKWLDLLEHVSRPRRLDRLVSTRLAHMVNYSALIMGAVLLMVPLGMIPFSNTLPALAVLFLSIGLLRCDGLCVLCGHFLNLATFIYFAVLLLGGGVVLREVFRYLFGGMF